MIDINLLPWREHLRKETTKEFLMLFAISVCLTIFILALVVNKIKIKIQHQQIINDNLQHHVDILSPKLSAVLKVKNEFNRLNQKIAVLEQLQFNRNRSLNLLNQMRYKVPPGMYLTRLEKKGSQLTLEGVSSSNALVSEFMQNLEKSKWIYNANLAEMRSEESKGYYFKITGRI